MYKTEYVIENKTQNIFWDFEIQTDHPIHIRRPAPSRKEEEKMLDPGLHHIRKPDLKESEKIDKHLDFARELRNLWNMKEKVEPVIIGELETIWKNPQTSRKTVNQMNN